MFAANYGAAPDALLAIKGVSVKETGVGNRRTTEIVFHDAKFPVVDETGTVAKVVPQIYTFPESVFIFEGAAVDLTLTKDAAGVNDDWDGDVGLGTTVGAGATLATTEQDYVPTTPTPQAVSGATTAKAISTGTEAPKLWNGSAGAKQMFLNLLVDDGDQDVTTTPTNLILNGSVIFNWTKIGDI